MSDAGECAVRLCRTCHVCWYVCERRIGRMADALAHGGDEGRDKLR